MTVEELDEEGVRRMGEDPGAACFIGELSQIARPDAEALIGSLVGRSLPARGLQWIEDHPDTPLGPFARQSLAELASRETLLIYLAPAEVEDEPSGADTMGRAYRDQQDALHDLGVHTIGVSTQPLSEQHELADVELFKQTLLADERLVLARTLGLPVTIRSARAIEYQPIVLIVKDGRIAHVIYPIGSPRASAKEALEWLAAHVSGHPGRAKSDAPDTPPNPKGRENEGE
jgi:peroxiredoxin